MSYRNKVFVSFDGDQDIHYYRLMRAWKQSDNTPFNFYDAHDINSARDTSTEETIKKRLRERLENTKVFVLLVGKNTRYLYKFVRWEIEQAISLSLPIIVVNLNGLRSMDSDLCPSIVRDELAMHISFKSSILQYALEKWPFQHQTLKEQFESGPYYYKSETYERLGL
ncbi:MAG: TIR domain-containing protein [Bdellovibrionales bacterium]|nr:TIR domain-containing protein [Bdellovibrionales bacterium]